ncbi:unnamed protein product [Ceutorhynchus assimilis]|uniref:SH3 domain-containing protein n=1 Tax=Ceutorhynchus assimilis TaxID=467358 RepID=A0A9N9MF20_9CUCU|nr:unnamed protein product [Ceutorhynchus assimilis]
MSETRSETSVATGELKLVCSLYDFKATHAKTISFKANQLFILQQINKEHRNWWEVIDVQGDVGYIPSNYVKIITITPAFYVKFLDMVLENLEKRGSEEMVMGLKTQTMARIKELRSQAEQIQESHSATCSAPNVHNVKPNCTPTVNKDSKSHLNSNSDAFTKYNNSPVCEDISPVVVEGPTEAVTEDLDSLEKGTEEVKSEIYEVNELELQKPVTNDSFLNVSPVITSQSVYELIESVRINTNLSHEKSGVAVETVVQGLHELLPASIFPYLSTILTHCQSCLVVDDAQIDQTHDASRLKIIFKGLTNCKDDSEQRSWMLHEDEGIIKEYITELNSILSNADVRISRHVISSDQFHAITTLIEYYQMEVRWPIRQLLLQAFGVLCSLDKTIIDIMLNSVLPGELARDMMANPRNITKLNYSGSVLIMIFSTGDPMPVTDLDYFSQQFLRFVFHNIECPIVTDVDDQIPDLFLNFILAFNLQFKEECSNPIINVLESQKQAQTICEKLLLLLNREEDPIRIFEHEPAPPHSLLKLFKDIFSQPTTAGLFYTNDAKVLIDITLRNITNLSSGDQKRTEYLELSRRILRNTNYHEHKHKVNELLKCFTQILKEENILSKPDQNLVNEIFTEFPQYFSAGFPQSDLPMGEQEGNN